MKEYISWITVEEVELYAKEHNVSFEEEASNWQNSGFAVIDLKNVQHKDSKDESFQVKQNKQE